MSSKTLRNVGIVGTGSYVPEKVVTNKDLEKVMDTSDEWITTRTGIKERRIVKENEITSDMSYKAALRALEDAHVEPEDLDLIIVASVTPDMAFPATACIVQHRLGAKKAGAFDLEAGCSGFVYALSVGWQFVATGLYDKVLVIGAETLSKIVNWDDRNTAVLFGDGAGAAVLSPVDEPGILSCELGSRGEGGELLKMEAGGSRLPASLDTVKEKKHTIYMAGNEVYKFAVRIMGEASLRVIEKAGLKKEDVDYLIPHQANIRIIDSARKRLGLSEDKVFVNLHKYGNTSSASVAIALDEAVKEGKISKGSNVVLVAFGAGLTWAAMALRWVKE